MEQRNIVLVMLLMFVTCGLYSFYHAYVTTLDVIDLTGKTDINVGLELLVNILTCGMFGMFVEYRNQQLIDEWYHANSLAHEPKAGMVGMLNIATFFVGLTWIIATFIYQEELNKLIALRMGHVNGHV